MNEVPDGVSVPSQHDSRQALSVHPVHAGLSGAIVPPSDKSVTHRALFFGALNHGRTTILNPSTAADCRSTLALIRQLGYGVTEDGATWIATGEGIERADVQLLDCGNSGTTARLAAGFLTGERGLFTLTGDASLLRRPMERVARPLSRLGASVTTTDGHMPVVVRGEGTIRGNTDDAIEVASAQVHGALVLAGLRSQQGVVLRRTAPMRDHTLRMARHFGAGIRNERVFGLDYDHVVPTAISRDVEVVVPGDFSSAAFFIAAALLVPGSDLTLHNVGINPTRIAFLHALNAMGADIEVAPSEPGVEPVGRIRVRYTPRLHALTFDADNTAANVAEMMDELPLLALVASQAHGTTIVRGASELRVKESDRIAAIAGVLRSLGVSVVEHEDGFGITGPQKIRGGCTIDHHGDHRICMMSAVAALVAGEPVTIPDPEAASVSYPEFWNDLDRVAGSVVQRSGGA